MTTKRSFKTWRRAAAGFAVAALLLAACGGGENETSKQSPSEGTATVEPTEEPVPDESEEPADTDTDAPGSGDNGGSGEAPSQITIESDQGDATVTDRGVVLGNVDAPYQVRVIGDLRCPYCAQLAETMAAAAEEWIQGDEVAIEYVTTTVLDSGSRESFSARAANILAIVADRDLANWGPAQDALYRLQPEQGEIDPTNEDFLNAIAEVGVEVDADFKAAVEAMKFDAWNEANTDWAREDVGIEYVPMVYLNGSALDGYESYEDIVEAINDAVASK